MLHQYPKTDESAWESTLHNFDKVIEIRSYPINIILSLFWHITWFHLRMPNKIRKTMRYFCTLQICVLLMSVLSSIQADIRNKGGHMSHEPALSPSLCGNGWTDEDVFFYARIWFQLCLFLFCPFLNLMFVSLYVFFLCPCCWTHLPHHGLVVKSSDDSFTSYKTTGSVTECFRLCRRLWVEFEMSWSRQKWKVSFL